MTLRGRVARLEQQRPHPTPPAWWATISDVELVDLFAHVLETLPVDSPDYRYLAHLHCEVLARLAAEEP